MRLLKNLGDYFALRAYLREPWAFVWSGKRDGEFAAEFREGFTVRGPSSSYDRQLLNDIFARDTYRVNGIAPGSWETVLDVGANIGLFSIRVAPLARRVLAFEPMASNFGYLSANVGRFRQVVPIGKAVAGIPGAVDLHVSKNPGAHSLLPTGDAIEKVRVDAVTFGQIFSEHAIDRCSLLKMDCEGAEYESLAAMPAEIWPRIDRVHLEYHAGPPGWNGERLAALLRERGFRCEIVPRSRHADKGNLYAGRA